MNNTENALTPKKSLHTIIEKKYYDEVLMYGKGSLKQGIINLVEIANEKNITLTIPTVIKINNLIGDT